MLPLPTASSESPPEELFPEADLSNFNSVKPRLDKLISDWEPERTATITRREVRNIDVSVEALKTSGELDETDTFVPIRVIDTNIRREQPPFIAFLKQSKRLASFTDIKEPSRNTTDLENEFTRVLTYIKWETPHFKCLDGAQTHGWAAIEVVFDVDKPGHVSFDYIAHEDLIFPLECEEFQANEIVLRRFSISILKLKSYVREFSFDPVQVKLIVENKKDLRADENIVIYKCFYKKDGVVYVGWFSKELGCTDWLKKPDLLFLGISEQVEVPAPPAIDPLTGTLVPQPLTTEWQDSPISIYPIFLLPYTETEQKKIVDFKGRVFLDKHKQEAMTTGWSSFLSAQNLAAGVLASLDRESTGGAAKLESVKVQHGKVINEKVNFFHTNFPDPSMLLALQALDTQNSQETGQVAFAVKNRQDSRKTATEVQASKETTSELGSVQVTLYSTHIREIASLAWKIIQSQALQEKIVFLFKSQVDPMTGMETGTNDLTQIAKEYDLRAAGDTDVIRRAELLEEYQAILPLLQGTPIYEDVLAEIVKLTLSDKGTILAEKLKAGDPANIIAGLLKVLQGAISPQEQAMLAPDEINSLKAIISEGVSYLQRVGYQPPQQPQGKGANDSTAAQNSRPSQLPQQSPTPTGGNPSDSMA